MKVNEKGNNSNTPPKGADFLLKMFFPLDQLEEIQGDLYELFQNRVKLFGSRNAKQMYWADTMRFLNPLVKKRKDDVNFQSPEAFGLARHYFTSCIRDFQRNKLSSFINLFGLSIGFAAFLLIVQYVRYEKSYDNFHKNIEDIYRVPFSWEPIKDGKAEELYASNVPAFGPAAKSEFSEIQAFTRLFPVNINIPHCVLSYIKEDGSKISFNEKKGYYADPGIFKVFTFPLIAGNMDFALSQPNAIIISESLKKKYFKEGKAIGKIIEINNGRGSSTQHSVTGVFKDIPQNSHLRINFLLSFNNNGPNSWVWSQFYTYVKLVPGSDPNALQKKMQWLLKKYKGEENKNEVFLQPVKEIHLRSHLRFEAEPNGSEKTVDFLFIIAFLILTIALINYINLSSSKALQRAKEFGIRKVIGANRRQLFIQFIFQAFIANCFAGVVALLIILGALPMFLTELTSKALDYSIFTNSQFYFLFFSLIAFGAVLSGIYPAYLISSHKSKEVLKGQLRSSPKGVFVRKTLVATQFIASTVLAITTIIIIKQFIFMQNQDLGFKIDQTLILEFPGIQDSSDQNRMQVFKNEVLKNPVISKATFSSNIPGKEITQTRGIKRTNGEPKGNTNFFLLSTDADFIDFYNIDLIAGRGFVNEFNEKNAVIINESALRQLKFDNAESAINQKIVIGGEKREVNIIGVIKNFHNKSLQNPYESIVLFPDSLSQGYFSVSLNTTEDLFSTINAIENVYKKVFPEAHIDYFFLDEFFNQQYQLEERNIKFFTSFSVLSIIIACLGLVGLTAFSTVKRTKEMGIRKVLGASTENILFLFLKELIITISIACIIAWPIAYYIIDIWLSNYAFKIEVSFTTYIYASVLIGSIAISSVFFQIMSLAALNPVKYLRNQ